ncbi:hypothetical protein [uncultured Gammaproteobacteria bacterium]|nr:hypothetical protein [uncultured Gammaproteobacteria bacterium]
MPFFKSPNKKPYFTQSYALSINKKDSCIGKFQWYKIFIRLFMM